MKFDLNEEQLKVVNADEDRILVRAAAGSGKALKNGSVIYTDNGPIKIEDSQVGMKIYGEDGELHNIIGVYPQGKKKQYIVRFSDGTSINCCNEHLWTFQTENLRSKKSKTYITASLQEIIEKYPIWIPSRGTGGQVNYNKRRNLFIPMTQPINFPHKEIPLDAYTLGALLGDGCLVKQHLMFTNEDKDILEKVSIGLKEIDCKLKYKENYDYSINQQGIGVVGSLTTILRELNLLDTRSGDKFIPDIYKYNDIDTRLAVIQGLIDTDGYCAGSSYDITLKSKQLILDLQEMCESLGLTAVYQEKQATCFNSATGLKDCGTVYRLRIKTSVNFPKLHSSEKREKQWKPSRVYSHRAIEEIIETDEMVEMTCIQVDNPTALFLTNHFIVTHNTRVLTERVRRFLDEGVEPSSMVCITFTNMAATEMLERLGDVAKGMFINTIHSYANYLLVSHGIDTKHWLDTENFDKLFELVKQHPECIKPVDYMFIDEGQDLTDQQYEFLIEIVNPTHWFIVGDTRQAIFRWAGADPDIMILLSHTKGIKTYELRRNYRCGQSILRFARGIIHLAGPDYDDNSICSSGLEGKVLDINYSTEALVRGIIDYNSLHADESWGDWFILCRTNPEAMKISSELARKGIPHLSFKQKDLSKKELDEKMNSNAIKVLTIHASKGLERKNVAVIGAKFYDEEEKCIAYVAATRAEKLLIWTRYPKKTRASSSYGSYARPTTSWE